MIPYLDYSHTDKSGINIEVFHDYQKIPYIEKIEESYSISMHQHEFYEMVLILRGTCHHFYKGASVSLMPGDLFLIPPNQIHSYQFHESISLCNCQFYSDVLNPMTMKIVSDMEYMQLQKNPYRKTGSRKSNTKLYAGDINSQGIIHLDHTKKNIIIMELNALLQEHLNRSFGFEYAKRLLLEHILLQIKRIQLYQFEYKKRDIATWKEDMIQSVLHMIEEDVTQNYDFDEIARTHNISLTYFRNIFKNFTGLRPVEYLNRARILRALELLQVTHLSVSDIAERVGIYDANYFSRMFKQFIGYPPRYFKAIKNHQAE